MTNREIVDQIIAEFDAAAAAGTPLDRYEATLKQYNAICAVMMEEYGTPLVPGHSLVLYGIPIYRQQK